MQSFSRYSHRSSESHLYGGGYYLLYVDDWDCPTGMTINYTADSSQINNFIYFILMFFLIFILVTYFCCLCRENWPTTILNNILMIIDVSTIWWNEIWVGVHFKKFRVYAQRERSTAVSAFLVSKEELSIYDEKSEEDNFSHKSMPIVCLIYSCSEKLMGVQSLIRMKHPSTQIEK